MSKPTVTVSHYEPRDRWLIKDNFNDVVGNKKKKHQAVHSAKRFTQDRSNATGATFKLKIEKMDGTVSKTHKYKPEF